MNLVFDIGGTNIRLAKSNDGASIDSFEVMPTPQDFEKAVELISNYYKKIGNEAFDKCVCGLPGVLSQGKDSLLSAPNLFPWVNKPIKEELTKILGKEVILENDAALAALGEAVSGAGRENKIVAYLTIGTGVGGARVVDGNLDERAFGFEPGHQIIDLGGSVYSENTAKKYVELENAVSGTALRKNFGKEPAEISDLTIWREWERLLSVGLANLIVHWSPNIVILGGGVMQVNLISLDRIKLYLSDILKVTPDIPQIKKGELGDKAGIMGGLAMLR